MYEFILTEVWWMEALISSLITAVVTIVGSLVVYNYKMSKIIDNTDTLISNDDSLKEGQHGLFNDHHKLSKEHQEIKNDIKQNIVAEMRTLNTVLTEEKIKQEFRYKNLDSSQKSIVDSVENLREISNEMMRLKNENDNLWNENYTLKEKSKSLEEKLRHYKDRGHDEWER